MTSYRKMGRVGSSSSSPRPAVSWRLATSYLLDWVVLVVIVVVGGFLGRIEPNKRPFLLDDANIA